MFENLTKADSQNLTYLLILLSCLAIPLFFRRNFPWLVALKYLALWAVVALLAVALYAYRFEFSDFKNRMLGELSPTVARLNSDNELVINLSSDGHFYIDTIVNQVPMRFMIDTGASDIVIDREQAQKLGINLQDLIFNKRYQTANGVSFGASIVLQEIKLGGVVFEDVKASVNSSSLQTPLLGMSFLRQFRKYEFYQDKLVLKL